MAAFKKGHVKVVKYMVRKVTQFPSDQECYNYIQSIKDKDPDLRMRCAQCVEIIITAKERQEKEANKHADSLLKLIEAEKMQTEIRNRKKIQKKANKRIKKENHKVSFYYISTKWQAYTFYMNVSTKSCEIITYGTSNGVKLSFCSIYFIVVSNYKNI